MSRLMKIINYDPIQYIRTDTILKQESSDDYARRKSYIQKKRISGVNVDKMGRVASVR